MRPGQPFAHFITFSIEVWCAELTTPEPWVSDPDRWRQNWLGKSLSRMVWLPCGIVFTAAAIPIVIYIECKRFGPDDGVHYAA